MFLAALATVLASAAHAGSQSSNSSSNSSSNNGVVRERISETRCRDGFCERRVQRRIYRDDGRAGRRGDDGRRYQRGRDRDDD